jgi:vacuolar-type H+-ATPase subunit H
MKSESNTKTVDELIAEEVAYATAIRGEVVSEAAAHAAAVVGNIKESAEPTTLLDEFEAIVSRNKKG